MFKPGEVIDGYVVLEVFPPGGFGHAYLVYPEDGDRLKDRVVLKLLPEGTLEAKLEDRGGYFVYSMLRRAPVRTGPSPRTPTGKRARPGTSMIPLLPCLAEKKTPHGIYMLTEYCPGGSLGDLLDKQPRGIPAEKAFRYIRHVLRAVCALHAQGLSHNDIKPANIFLRGDSSVLGDYSILSRTESIPAYGTPGYMAPERISGTADQRSDVYSVGITLSELITGLPPEFHMDLPLDLDSMIRHIVEKAKKYDPRERYPTAAAMLQEVERCGVERGWWKPSGVTAGEARLLEDAFISGIARNLSPKRAKLTIGQAAWSAQGGIQERSEMERVRSIAAREGKLEALQEIPNNRRVARTFRLGWPGRRLVLVGVSVSPLEELLRDGATAKLLTQSDLCSAAREIADDETLEYVIAVFAPCGWAEDCTCAQGENWRAFPVDKLEDTRWRVNIAQSDPVEYETLFDPELREQKVQRIQSSISSRPDLHRPDGTIVLTEVMKTEDVAEDVVAEAFELLCRDNKALEIIDLPGFGRVLARKGYR